MKSLGYWQPLKKAAQAKGLGDFIRRHEAEIKRMVGESDPLEPFTILGVKKDGTRSRLDGLKPVAQLGVWTLDKRDSDWIVTHRPSGSGRRTGNVRSIDQREATEHLLRFYLAAPQYAPDTKLGETPPMDANFDRVADTHLEIQALLRQPREPFAPLPKKEVRKKYVKVALRPRESGDPDVEEREAAWVGRTFAATESDKDQWQKGRYGVTHLPTGLSVSWLPKTKAVAAAKLLERTFPGIGAGWAWGEVPTSHEQREELKRLSDFIQAQPRVFR